SDIENEIFYGAEKWLLMYPHSPMSSHSSAQVEHSRPGREPLFVSHAKADGDETVAKTRTLCSTHSMTRKSSCCEGTISRDSRPWCVSDLIVPRESVWPFPVDGR